MKLRLLMSACALLITLPALSAECTYPKAPENIPDGKSASEAEMISAMSAFKTYNANVTAYLTCLNGETTAKLREAAGTTAVMQIKTLQSKKHNSAVDELQALAGQFNEQVRAFKSRS